jgi:hypothetical protein
MWVRTLRDFFTIALQVILGDATLVHPHPQALIANELHYPDSFIESSVLLLGAI